MVFGPTQPLKSPYFTHLATFPSQTSPTNSVDEANVLGVIERMDPAEAEFRYSVNGALWVFLEGDPTHTIESPSEKFARDFKAKWIRPIDQRGKGEGRQD
jgi:hypothetical protein